MSSEPPAEGPVPREVPPPPGASLPDVVDEIEERVAADVQREVHGGAEQAQAARTADQGEGPSQDVVPDSASAEAGDLGEGVEGIADSAADPTLSGDVSVDDTTDGMPRSEPTD